MRAGLGVLAASGLLVMLGGCGSSGYSDVLELRDAAMDAGLQCPDWERTSDTTGTCSEADVLILSDDIDAEVDHLMEFAKDYGVPVTLLVGDNWVVNSPDAADLKDDLGGEVVTG